MASSDDKYIVRLPYGLRDKIKCIAARNRRSMNSQIVIYLEEGMQN